jgi:hypothetical protein
LPRGRAARWTGGPRGSGATPAAWHKTVCGSR